MADEIFREELEDIRVKLSLLKAAHIDVLEALFLPDSSESKKTSYDHLFIAAPALKPGQQYHYEIYSIWLQHHTNAKGYHQALQQRIKDLEEQRAEIVKGFMRPAVSTVPGGHHSPTGHHPYSP
ncbi:hypothetical protein BGW39_005304 [Mortierella sp. 14UC]|nr:hypothetical protein BGW39_005304 [Mortierella sp. 14UC]